MELPNIILIIMDSAAAKRCSVYGHHRETTPGLRQIAREGVLYKHCFAPAPWTIPSHASLFSGLYVSEHGCDEKSFQIPEVFFTLPQILQQLGYHTVAITSNQLVSFQRGFEVFYEMNTLFASEAYHQARMDIKTFKQLASTDMGRLKLLLRYLREKKYYSYPVIDILDRLYRKYYSRVFDNSYYATENTLNISKILLKKYKNKQPLFLLINFMETHWRYNPPKKYYNIVKMNWKERRDVLNLHPVDLFVQGISDQQMAKLTLLYEQEIAYLDNRLVDFYGFLEKLGVKDRTLFIVTADHGEPLGEHGLWGHYFGLWNELIHIPLIIKYPDSIALQGESNKIVQLHDLFATLLEVTGAPFPVPQSSRSLLGEAREFALAEHLDTSIGLNACRRRDPHFQPQDFMQPCRCLIDAELHKLIQWADGRMELYDLKKDYAEEHNLINHPAYNAKAADLEKRLEEMAGPWAGNQPISVADFPGPSTPRP